MEMIGIRKVHVLISQADLTHIVSTIVNALDTYQRAYSYVVRYGPKGYDVQVNVNTHDVYNTYDTTTLAALAADDILEHSQLAAYPDKVHVVGYKNPPLDTFVRAGKPFVAKLARTLRNSWTTYEQDDMEQVCWLVIVRMYNKGLYLYPGIIEHAVRRQLISDNFKEFRRPVTISLETEVPSFKRHDSTDSCYADIISDKNECADKILQDIIDEELLFTVCKLCKMFIGERMYDQLVREYDKKQLSLYSRQTIQALRKKLASVGIDKDWLRRNK